MASFWEFFTSFLASHPEDLASDDRLFAEELPNPKRLRFRLDTAAQPGGGDVAAHAHAMQALARYFNNYGDVANVSDLHGFDELGGHDAIPTYIN